MFDAIFSLLLGLGPGAIFALLAVGVVIAYRGSGVINFSHGAIAMYTARTFNRLHAEPDLGGTGEIFLPWVDILPEWVWLKALRLNNLPVRITIADAPLGTAPAVAISLAMAALIGGLLHLVVFRPLRQASPLSRVVGSVGAMIYLQALASLHFGTRAITDLGWGPYTRNDEPIENFLGLGSNLPRSTAWLLVTGTVIVFFVWAMIRFTRFGLAARAVDENERGLALLGYSADRIAAGTWILSAILAGVVGVIFVGFTQPANMTLLVVPALGAALVGNLTSITGAFLGGLAIAMLQSFGVWLAVRPWWPEWLPANGVRQVVPLLIVVAVLYLRGDRLPVRGSLIQRSEPRAPLNLRPGRDLVIVGVLAMVIALVGGWKWDSGLTTTLIAGIFMLSLVVLVGFLGQISLAQWTIAGLAGYTAIRLASNGTLARPTDLLAKNGLDLPSPLAALFAVAVAVLAGVLIGLPALRIRGFHLAVISIAAVIAIEDLLLNNDVLMGAGAASNNPVPIPRWFGVYVGAQRRTGEGADAIVGSSDNMAFTVLVVIMTLLVALAVINLRRGVTGRRFISIRSNERAAAAAGINVMRTKLLGFGIASGMAGIAGVLFTYKLPAVTGQNFGLFPGLALMAFAYLAGITTARGALLGGVLVAGGLLAAMSGAEAGSASVRYSPLVAAIGLLAASIMANGEGVIRLSDRYKRWRTHLADQEFERTTWGPAGRWPMVVLGGIAAADFMARGVLPIALEDLQDEFGFSDTQAGLLSFADVVAGASVVVIAGWMADRMKRTRLLTVLLIVWAGATALNGAVQTFAHLFALRVALGLFTAIDDPSSSSLIADFYPMRLRARAFSWRIIAPVAGGAVGGLAAGIMIDQRGWREAYLICAIPALVAAWFVAKLREPERGEADEIEARAVAAQADSLDSELFGADADADPTLRTDTLEANRDEPVTDPPASVAPTPDAVVGDGARPPAGLRSIKSLPWMIMASALSFGPAIGVAFWAPTFLRRHHDLTAAEAAGLFSFAALLGALGGARLASRLPQQLSHWKHANLKIAAIAAEIGVLFLMLAYAPTPTSLKFPLLAIGAAGLVAAGPLLTAEISAVTPTAMRGRAFSVNGLFRLIFSALTPLMIGVIADQVTFVDENVPVPIEADDRYAADRADRFECIDGRVKLGEDSDGDRRDIPLYECGDDEVGHLGAGMVSVLLVGGLSGVGAMMARRHVDDDLAAVEAAEGGAGASPPEGEGSSALIDA